MTTARDAARGRTPGAAPTPRLAEVGAWAVAFALALKLGVELWRFATASTVLPLWDMAKYGVSGLRLADAVRGLDPVGWLREIHGMSTWPPVWPMTQSGAFLIFGDDISVARGLIAVTWMFMVAAAFWAMRPLGSGLRGHAVGLLAAAWVAQSPLLQALATVNLLEVPGTFVLLVCLGCALRAIPRTCGAAYDARAGNAWWRATWASALVLFFLKYNYGLLWLLPLLLGELVRRRGGWRGLAGWSWLRARSVRWTPWTVFLAVVLVLLAAIRLSGGIEFELFGQRVRATSIGNPAYGLLLLVCLRTLVGGKASWRDVRRRWRRLDASWHGFGTWLVAPILAWMLLPPHVKEFFGFVENRSSGLGLAESLAFYPGVVMEQYSGAPWLGALALLLAIPACGWLASRDPRRRLLALATLTSCLALAAHPYKLPRFAAQAAVLIGLLASAWLVMSALARRRRALAWTVWAMSVGAAVGVAALGVDQSVVESQHQLRTVPAESAAVADGAARVALDGGVVLGTWNGLSPALVEWHARRLRTLSAGWRPTTTFDLDRRSRSDVVLRQLESEPCRTVALIGPEHPSWHDENAWLAPVEARLRIEGAGWTADEATPGLTVFRCSPPEP